MVLLGALGFSSGLPYLLTSQTLGARLANQGVALTTIGLFALVGLPYSFKFAWAPLMDRFAPPWLGRRRGWIAAMQVALAVAVAGLGLVRPGRAALVAACALVVALLSATQDVACDAYNADLLAPGERAAGSAVFVFGYRVAMVVAGALALVASERVGWRAVYLGLGGLLLAGTAVTVAAPEPPPATPPRTLAAAVADPFVDFFRRRGALPTLGFVLTYRLGELVAASLVTPFLVGLGFGNGEIGAVWKGVGLAATVGGALAGGPLTARLGLRRALLAYAAAQAAANLGYAALAVAGRRHGLLVAVVAVDQGCAGLAIGAFVALLMALTDRRYSATQFALLTSASGVAARLVGSGSGWFAARAGWPIFFCATAAATAPALMILSWSRSLQEQIRQRSGGIDGDRGV